MRVLSLLLLLGLVTGTGCKKSGEATCRRAGEKLAACFTQMFGETDDMVRTASANATSQAAIDECAADSRSVEAYEACNAIEDCGAFIECTERFAPP